MLYVHISNIKWVMVNQHSLPSWLIVSRLRAFDDCAIVRKVFRYRRGNQNQETEEGQTCNVRLYVVINVLMCDWVVFFSMEGDIYWLFIVFIYMLHLHCSRRMRARWLPINRFKIAVFWPLFQANTYISNALCHGLCVQWMRASSSVCLFRKNRWLPLHKLAFHHYIN